MEQQRVHDRTDEYDDREPRDERERDDLDRADLDREDVGTEEGTFDRADVDQRTRMDGDGIEDRTDDRIDDETDDEAEAAETRAEAGREEAADEQLTVPEDRDAAAVAAGRTTSTTPDATTAPAAATATGESFELFEGSDRDDYRRRWETVQASFVDDPRGAAQQADGLLGEVVEHVARRRQQLHDELGGTTGGDDTEAMRLALRRYRDLFHALMGG